MTRTIGLTGGIATGKTTAADYLARAHGAALLDADRLAREAVAPGTPALAAIADRYGPEILQPDGTLDRARLGEIVFNDAAERTWVEAQIHPVVRDRLRAGIAAWRLRQSLPDPAGDGGPLVLVVPLLFEAGLVDLVEEVWVVACPEPKQRDRLAARNGLTDAQARARIASQMPLKDKCDRADWVLDNSGSPEGLYRQIDRVMAAPPPHRPVDRQSNRL